MTGSIGIKATDTGIINAKGNTFLGEGIGIDATRVGAINSEDNKFLFGLTNDIPDDLRVKIIDVFKSEYAKDGFMLTPQAADSIAVKSGLQKFLTAKFVEKGIDFANMTLSIYDVVTKVLSG